ncbi:MAG: type I 3-dehydroquinate dehydratase [Spirochaetaceae bacterium]|jgi:3-dehydroquinate dehydratase/shikimate dehydrogenase|nr:type I 3-dehydroquinate dehydratase [Spirochaetaceae bacterium]
MAKICLCLTGKTLEANLETLEKYRKYVDLAELRADFLDPDERLLIRRFPALVDIPVILTVRRASDGGRFQGGEGARITLLCKALAFAEVDRRKNFAYVDLEEDLNVPSLEEAARTFGSRVIRSFHNLQGVDADLAGRLRGLLHVGDEIPKAAVSPRNLADVLSIYRAVRGLEKQEKIVLGMGAYGLNTRILAERLGSFLSYTSARDEGLAAPGQLDPRELAETYRFRKIDAGTELYGIAGFPLTATSSPPFFNKVYSEENINAVYVPFPSDTMESFMELAGELKLRGASVTVPYKEKVLPYLHAESEVVRAVGACNTLVATPEGWQGYNTDCRGFSDSLLDFAGGKDLKGRKITILGAGGAARAVAFEVHRLRGKALILNRTASRAKRLAEPYRFAWAGIDSGGAELISRYRDIIVQTTSLGMEPGTEGDPLPDYHFSGRELVMDLIYKPERTRFLKRAADAGCAVRNGYDMLIRQAVYQYAFFMKTEFPARLLPQMRI